MRFTFADAIAEPDAKLELTEWCFAADLRNEFDVDNNHDVTRLLEKRGVITKDNQIDTESACTWVYFASENAARAFLRRLNAQPEIKKWVKPTKQRFILLKEKEFKALQKYIKTLPKKHQAAIQALSVGIYGVQEHYTNF